MSVETSRWLSSSKKARDGSRLLMRRQPGQVLTQQRTEIITTCFALTVCDSLKPLLECMTRHSGR